MDDQTQSKIDNWFNSDENLDDLFTILGMQSSGSSSKADFVTSGYWAAKPDDSDFDYEFLESEETISEKRHEELRNGSKPTTEELAKWRCNYEEYIRESDTMSQIYTIWKIESNRKEYFLISFQGDGGIFEDKEGPFKTFEEAKENLKGSLYDE